MPPAVATRKSLEPWIHDSIVYYKHQVEGIRHLAKRKNFLLADDMGLGKTLQCLTIFAIDVFRGWADSAIVVCPILLKGNWADEIEKFTRFNHMVLEGTVQNRIEQIIRFSMMESPKILIVNYEQVSSHLAILNKLDFSVGIFDESHYLKNPDAERSKAALALKTRRVFMLSGTPMLNTVNELWTSLHKISPKGFPDYYRFLNRYCIFGDNRQVVGVKNEQELTDSLGKVMLRRLKSEVLDLPEVQIIERKVDLLSGQQELYDRVNVDMVLDTIDGPEDIEYLITKYLRLRQICGNTRFINGEDISAKLDLAVEDDAELIRNGAKTVSFTQFRDVLECYTDRLLARGIKVYQLHGDIPSEDRMPIVRAWTADSEPSVMASMIQVGGIGVNLTASSDIAFLDELFVPGLNQQAIDRVHRIGVNETKPVRVRKYLARGTYDIKIEAICRAKLKLSKRIIDMEDIDWKPSWWRR